MSGSGSFGGADVTHESGVSRFCKSIFVAVCVAPLVLIGGVCVLGYNEHRAVCSVRAIDEGKKAVTEVGCDSATAGDGRLVMFSCDLKKDGLKPLSPSGEDFKERSFQGTGLETTIEMYQCVEKKHSTTKKDKAGGGTSTETTYSYDMQWMSSWVDRSKFNQAAEARAAAKAKCGDVVNPQWSDAWPANGVQYAEEVQAGAFTLPREYVKQVPLDSQVTMGTAPARWSFQKPDGEGYYFTGGGSNGIGRVRVKFAGNDWKHPAVTALGHNAGGQLSKWTASDSWMCAGFSLGEVRKGQVSKDDLFAKLETEANMMTYVLRAVGFLLSWFAFSLLFVPLEVAADCIPCIGPCLGDNIAAVTCCISCLPGLACSLGVAGCVWVFMRPMVGIPLLAVFVITLGGFIFFKIKNSKAG
eukprot:CAMPEP_0198506140 /NCGR_PEP_ID=MMETSP1462-20131121/11498_1 /TAXON_ID=1333877 /ORGANISM="Brandtodinium nutriculum, Strain RCC3387" /LENGTH=412 /DNA_ID=CAMNT_0044235349 /DNA_START=78 /DNA_END=1312 /DNA_ORIENTATION=-